MVNRARERPAVSLPEHFTSEVLYQLSYIGKGDGAEGLIHDVVCDILPDGISSRQISRGSWLHAGFAQGLRSAVRQFVGSQSVSPL